MGADGADDADIPQCAGQTVELCNAVAVGLGLQLRQKLRHNGAGEVGPGAEIPAVIHGHQLDKAHVHGILLCQPCQRRNFIVVEAADEDGIDLDPLKPGIEGGLETVQRLA